MKISFQKYVALVFVPLIAVGILLYYVASNSVEQFFEHERILAQTSVNSADSLIQQYLVGLRKNVGHFASDYEEDIKNLVDHPHDKALYQKLRSKVESFFPGATTYTLANSQGQVLLDDVDTLIGNGCRENIRLFAISNLQSDAQLRIHSDRLDYHFDIMHEMNTNDGRVMIFFVSFEPGDIASFISRLQLPGHQMMILKKKSDSLIEITRVGARVKLDREPNLDITELDRVMASKNVENTLWVLVDLLNTERIEQTRSVVMRDFGIIFTSFLLGTLLAVIAIMKHEKMRYRAESKLNSL